MKREALHLTGLATLLSTVPASAFAHFTTEMGDFYGGMLHPVTDSLILLPILGFGLWTSQQKTGQAGRMIVFNIIFLLLGALAGFWRTGFISSTIILICLTVLIGLLIMGRARPVPWIAFVLVMVFSILIGFVNVFEIKAEIQRPLLYTTGLSIGNGLAVFYVAGFLLSRKSAWKVPATRIAGGLIIVAGLLIFMIRIPA